MDWDNSYHTMSDENNYTIWHFLKVCHERGWLYQGTDVMPWCPRCGTGLSEHEIVTEGYKEVVHPGLFVRFPLEGRDGESLLVWTTTPWTLSSNVAAAVHPELTYVKVRQGDHTLYLAKALLSALRGDHQVLAELPGKELVGLAYHGPFDELPAQQGVRHRIISWSEVSESEGTGIVHIAPGGGQGGLRPGQRVRPAGHRAAGRVWRLHRWVRLAQRPRCRRGQRASLREPAPQGHPLPRGAVRPPVPRLLALRY